MLDPSLTSPLISGAFAFIGVVLAQAVVVWSQRRKVYDEDVRRWQADRRTLYARIFAEADAIEDRVSSCVDRNDPAALPNFHDRDDYVIRSLFDEALLIGSESVVETIQKLDAAIFARLLVTWRHAIDGEFEDVEKSEWERLGQGQRIAQIKFMRAAREELMMPWRAKKHRKYVLFPNLQE